MLFISTEPEYSSLDDVKVRDEISTSSIQIRNESS